MKKIPALLTILGTTALAACGGADTAPKENTSATSGSTQAAAGQAVEATGEVYSGDGDITEISGNKVTISHGPVEGIGWPAMTMTFSATSPEMLRGLSVGDPVSFQFQEAGSDYAVTSISKAQ